MKYTFTIIFVLLLAFSLPAKPVADSLNQQRDSIETAMKNLPDSLKILSLIDLAELYLSSQPQEASIFGFRAQDLLGKPAESYYDEKIQETLLKIYSRLNINDKQIAIRQRLIKIAAKSNNVNKIARLERGISANLYRMGKTDLAKAELDKCLKKLSSINDDCVVAYIQFGCLSDYAAIYRDAGDYGMALKLYNRADSVCKKYRYHCTDNKIVTFIKSKDENDLKFWAISAAILINNIGDTYELSGRYKEAELCYQQFLAAAHKNKLPGSIRIALLNLASVNQKLGFHDKALEYQLKSIETSKKNNMEYYDLIDNIYLFGIYSGMRDYHNSAKVMKELEKMMFSYENVPLSTEVEIRYELEKREKQNEIKKLELNREKNVLYIFLLLIIVLMLLIGSLVFYKFKQNKVNKLKLEQGKTKAELLALQGKINPHFLFNSLNSLASLINSQSSNAAPMLQNLSRLLRYTLQSSKKALVPLSDELRIVRTYLEIELLRLADRLVYEIDCPADLEHIMIPPLIIQPLVENSIKHAVSQMIEGGEIKIKCFKENGYLKIMIKDNGPQLESKAGLTGGFGLDYIQDILQMTYGKSNLMSIRQTDGFEVNLLIPLN